MSAVDGHSVGSDDFTIYENVDNDVSNSMSMSTSRRGNDRRHQASATTPKCLSHRSGVNESSFL